MRREQSGWVLRLSNLFLCAGLSLTLQMANSVKAEEAGDAITAAGSRMMQPRRERGRFTPPSAISHGHIVKLPDIGYEDIPEMPWPLVTPPADHAAGCGDDCEQLKTSAGKALGHRDIECVAGCYPQPVVATALGGRH